MDKKVVLLKTHVWSDDIEKFSIKVYNETYLYGVDFFILMHTENDEIYHQVKSEKIKKIIIKFTEAEIKSIYTTGFISMWLSNHWILMWFYKKFGQKYKYFWSVEYDVRISGNSSKIWLHENSHDFLYTKGNYRNVKHKHMKFYQGTLLNDLEKFFGYLQLARYSSRLLVYLDKYFNLGENGADELIIFSLINKGKFTGSKEYLQSLIAGTWTWQDIYSENNKQLYNYCESLNDSNHLYIFHPIK
jgi:hypothetical protein